MAHAVPEIDVLQAADRVLARGERPTVERVRAELGRGSPARVGQLLDQWWEALAKRLAGETRLPELPADVAAAFKTVWTTASEHATTIAQQNQMAAQTALDHEKEALTAERRRWTAELEALQSAMAAAVEARAAAEQRVADLQRLVDQLRIERDDVIAQRAKTQERADRMERDFIQLGTKLEKQVTAIATERQSMADHIRSVEDRAHAEVDRARAEAKTTRQELQQLGRTSSSAARLAAEKLAASESMVNKVSRANEVLRARMEGLEKQADRLTGLLGRTPKKSTAKVAQKRHQASPAPRKRSEGSNK